MKPNNVLSEAERIALDVALQAKEKHKISLFSISSTANENNPPILFTSIRETLDTVAGNVIVTSKDHAVDIAKTVDGIVNVILVDVETKRKGLEGLEEAVRPFVKKSAVETFKPNDFTADACDALVSKLLIPLRGRKIAIIGSGNLGTKVALKLCERGANVAITRPDKENGIKIAEGLNIINMKGSGRATYFLNNDEACYAADMLVCFTPGTYAVSKRMVGLLKKAAIIIDGGIGTLAPDVLEFAAMSGRKVFCLDMRPGYQGAIATMLAAKSLVEDVMGELFMETPKGKARLVAGGIVGNLGDIVVDNIKNPLRVIGVANGKGDLLDKKKYSGQERDRVSFIQRKMEAGELRMGSVAQVKDAQRFESEVSLIFPNDIQIEMTNACNLNCKMCPRESMGRKIGKIDFSLFKKIISEIKKEAPGGKIKRLQMFKTGEPLLHPDFSEFVRYAKEQDAAAEICTVTNGVALTEIVAKGILDSGLDKITFSIDTADPKTYADIKGYDLLRTVEQNIINFLELRKKRGLNKPFIIVKMLKMNVNKSQVAAFRERWKKYPVDEVRIDRFFSWNNGVNDMSAGDEPKIKKRHACLNPWRLLVVDWNGDVVLCPLDYSGKVILGNLKKDSIKSIWQGEKLREIRLMHIKCGFGEFPLCVNCELWRNSMFIPKEWFLENKKY